VSKIEEEVGLSAHLVHHDYFRPVVYENNPIEELTDKYEEERLLEDEEEDLVKNVVPVTNRLIPGIHHGSKVYVDNLGFKYYKSEATANHIYLVCERQKNRLLEDNPCTASMSTQVDSRIRIWNRHNHRPVDINLHIPFLREAIGARSIDLENMSVSVRTAYNNAIV